MDKKIAKLLEASKIKFKILEHRKVYTAFTEAETQHVDPKTVVKTVLVKFANFKLHTNQKGAIEPLEMALVAVPAGKHVDFKKIAKFATDIQSKLYKSLVKTQPKLKKPAAVAVKMASEKDITTKLKAKVGLLSAFSQVYGFPLLFDKKLAKNKKLVIAAGSYTESVEVATKDFLKHMYGSQGNFSK